MRSRDILLPIVKKLFEDSPSSAAKVLETLDEAAAAQVLKLLSPSIASKIVKHLNVSYTAALLKVVEEKYFEHVMHDVDPARGAAIFMCLEEEGKEKFVLNISEHLKKKIYEQLNYPEDSIGRVMTADYISFYPSQKVKDVIFRLKQVARREKSTSYMYVVDEENRLIGVLNTRDLLVAEKEELVENVMKRDVFTVSPFTESEGVANELSSKKYFSAPVVDSENKLLGHVLADKLIREAQEEAAKDIQTMFGVRGEEKVFSSILDSMRNRLPWLHINLLTAFLAAAVIAIFEDTIARVTILAVFLPVVAGQGGNAGAQSLAIVMRGLVMREIPLTKQKTLIFKEAFLGLINGSIIGLVTAVIAFVWCGNPFIGVVIGLAMIVNLFFAGLAGSSIPIIMKSIGLDPAQCSNIILTTVTDVMGFFAFLGIATLFQNQLL